MDIQANIINSCCLAAISFLLYKTDFIVEYGKLFRLLPDNTLIDYLCFRIKNPSLYFLGYLRDKLDIFFTRLISCPYCIGFWLSFICCGFSWEVFFVYYVYILMYSVLLFIINGIRN